jgi:CO/xanthine dehydrogenase Mo-binding subunit
MAAAAHVVTGEYRTGANDHACMELEGGTGWLDGDMLVIRAPTLTPHAVRESIARALGWPQRRIRVEAARMGGSFGKYLVPGIETHIAVMVHATGRPVRLVLDRAEILGRRAKRHPFLGRYRLGLDRDGRFVALDADVIADAGPYASFTPTVVAVFADEATGAYEIPHVRVLARGVLTSNLPTAPMRGFGSQQINFGIESLVDRAARVVGISPVELRRRNFLANRKLPRGGVVPDPRIALPACLDRVVAELGPRPVARPGTLVGRGVAAIRCKYGYPSGIVDRFVVRAAVDAAGRFTVETDIADSGTGTGATAARLVARELGLATPPHDELATALVDDPSGTLLARGRVSPLARLGFGLIEWIQKRQVGAAIALTVRLTPSRQAQVLRWFARPLNALTAAVNWLKRIAFPHGIDSYLPRTSGSRGMLMVGRAAIDAARKLRTAAITAAAARWRVPADRIAATPAGVRELGGDRALTWGELAAAHGGSLAALGDACLPPGALLDPATGNQIGTLDYMLAVHGVDLELDVDTGLVTVLRYVGCQDVGHLASPEIVRGQVLGSIAMGVAQALSERIVVAGGAVENDRLHDYLVPTALDAPAAPILIMLDSGSGLGPSGAKGCGEVGTVAAPCATAAALHDALGVQLDLPATPDEILRHVSALVSALVPAPVPAPARAADRAGARA